MNPVLRNVAYFVRPAMLVILGLFFDKNYLKGKYFDAGLEGFLWCFKAIWIRNILRLAPPMPFPVALRCHVSIAKNIIFDPNDLNNFQSPGTYFQNFKARIYLGKGVYIAPNVGLITANHDTSNPDKHVEGKDIIIGDSCWIGMNSVILPGVKIGPHTTVAAGSVVTRSYESGFVVLAGAPAKPIKNIDIV